MPEGPFLVRDLMSERLVTIAPEATVAEALSLMDQQGVQELPVMTNSSLRGWISYRSFVRRGGIPSTTKVSSLMETTPRLRKDADVIEAAEVLIRSNVRAVPVADAKGKIVGILSRTDVMKAAGRMPELARIPIESAMNTELETVDETETIDQAINRLRELRISQLLMLDDGGRFRGAVRLEDIARAHAAEHEPPAQGRVRPISAHTQGKRKGSQIELKSFVKEAPVVSRQATLGEAIHLMEERNSNFVVVGDEGYAVGVVSRSNVLERMAALKPSKGVLCQIVGLAEHVDSQDLDRIYGLAESTLGKVAKEVKVEFLSLHYKIYKAKAAGDRKFSLSLHLSTERRFFVQKADAWDAIEATQMALDSLERRIQNLKDLRLERRKTSSGRKTMFYTATKS